VPTTTASEVFHEERAAPPRRFGMWQEGADPSELYCIAQASDTDFYRVSFTTDPGMGRVSKISFAFYPCEGCETPRCARLLPDFAVYNLSERYSSEVLSKLLALGDSDFLPLLDILDELGDANSLVDVIPDAATLAARFEGKRPEDMRGIVEQLLTHNHIPGFAAASLLEVLAKDPKSEFTQELLAKMCKHILFFEPAGREAVLIASGHMLRELAQANHALLKFSDPSDVLRSVQHLPARLGVSAVRYLMNDAEVFGSNSGFHHHNGGGGGGVESYVGKHVTAFLAESWRFDEPKKIFRALFEHALRIGGEAVLPQITNAEFQRLITEETATVERSLLAPYLNKRSDQSTLTVLKYCQIFKDTDALQIARELLHNRRFHVVDERMLKGHTIDGKDALDPLTEREGEERHSLDKHLAALVRHKRVFANLGDQALFEAVARHHSGKAAAFGNAFQQIPLSGFHDLNFAAAKEIMAGNRGGCATLLANLGAFRLSRDEFGEVLERAKRGEPRFLSILLNEIDRIPETYLRHLERDYCLHSYAKDCAIPSIPIFEEYRSLKRDGKEELCRHLVREVREGMDGLISSEEHTDAFFKSPRVRALVPIVYPNATGAEHVPVQIIGGRASETRENAENPAEWRRIAFDGCADRSKDLDRFTLRPVYRMNLAEGIELVLKPGAIPSGDRLAAIQQRIERGTKQMHDSGFDSTKMEERLVDGVKAVRGGRPVARNDIEIHIMRHFLECEHKASGYSVLADLLVLHQLVTQENVKDYLQVTAQRSEKAKNADYAQMLEWHEYFTDRLRDSMKAVLKKAFADEALVADLEAVYQTVRRREFAEWRDSTVNRFQIDKLGLSPGLKKKVSELQAEAEGGNDSARTALQRILDSERGKVAGFLSALTRREVDPSSVNLETFDAKAVVAATLYQPDKPDSDTLKRFFSERLLGLFSAETAMLGSELKKYVPAENQSRRAMVLEGYITKNLASSRARGCGGVCVANDNPGAHGGERQSQWDLPNYFQLVLRDAETKMCVGLVLLHDYDAGGKKFLAASFNPSSTYVFKVDERSLFSAILGALVEFAADNGFDAIGCSTQKGIRTNRTGGEFERAMDERIREVGRTFTLPFDAPFSFKPKYNQREFSVLWERTPQAPVES
jgi:hypothetical protein